MSELKKLRTDVTTWNTVEFKACHDERWGTFDGNSTVRYRVLLQLQYDRQDNDVGLIRHLFTNEIVAAENNSFQGCPAALKLAAFLMALFRDPNDVALFIRAKLANFDTSCDFPILFPFLICSDQTEAMIKAADSDYWDHQCAPVALQITSSKLDEWWLSICEEFPESEQDEDILALYQRALSFDYKKKAATYLHQWAEQEPDSEAKLYKLKYEYCQLGDYASAVKVCQQMRDLSESDWDIASSLRDMVSLQMQAGEFDFASAAAEQLDVMFATFDDWVGVGLGRMAVQTVFELSVAHPQIAEAKKCFSLADQWFQRSGDLSLDGMESAVKAAMHCELANHVVQYQRIAAVERKRIDELLSRSGSET